MQDLWNSTTDLLPRFNLVPETEPQMRKFFEEVAEFSREINFADCCKITDGSIPDAQLYDAAKEGVDVIVMVMQNLNTLGVTYDLFSKFVDYTIDKNDSKTPYTHEVINGIIQRKHGITSDPT